MFETAFIRKYLAPKRRALSSSLIALLSVTVITLVVWLVVLFLSVTEGIERNWLEKLTSLNAPLQIKPTEAYFSSYYYNVDAYSAASDYLFQSLGQKARALISDPYNEENDEPLPLEVAGAADRLEDGSLRDPVKELTQGLDAMGLRYQDVEISGALLRLDLIREQPGLLGGAVGKSHLTNVSYVASFPSKNPALNSLLLAPTASDLNNLITAEKGKGDLPWLQHADIEELCPRSELWRLEKDLLPEKTPFAASVYKHRDEISHLLLSASGGGESTQQTIERRGDRLFFRAEGEAEIPLPEKTALFATGKIGLAVEKAVGGMRLAVKGVLQGREIQGVVPLTDFETTRVSCRSRFGTHPEAPPRWPFYSEGIGVLPEREGVSGILLAKSYRKKGVRAGDQGYLAYSAPTLSGTKELKLPVYVAGFYDPGIMAVGNQCILAPPHITETINRSQSPYALDKTEASCFFVWLKQLKDAHKVKGEILEMLDRRAIGRYFTVETFHDYPFARPLMEQFQSDKYLFTIVGITILLVACTNIISLLVLLVSDKKREIGILRAMGAKRRSIAAIFALSGGLLGLMSCAFGLFLAWLTLHNIDSVVHFLSLLQGHDAFNPQFFGTSLPHTISSRALLFAAIATPVLALVSGLIPAIKAARLDPCDALRAP